MARMHTGKHGKSKSKKPIVAIGELPKGMKLTKEEVEKLILDYSKQGVSQALIGQRLKDSDGVPYIRQVLGKRLGDFLKEKGAAPDFPPDLLSLMARSLRLRRHLEKNRQDVHNRIRLMRVESKIWRLTKYYKSRNMLSKDWRYEPEKAALIIKG